MALDTTTTDEKPTNVAGERLRSIVERIERLEEERKALGSDIKDIYAEAKSAGFKSPLQGILSMYIGRIAESMCTAGAYFMRWTPWKVCFHVGLVQMRSA